MPQIIKRGISMTGREAAEEAADPGMNRNHKGGERHA